MWKTAKDLKWALLAGCAMSAVALSGASASVSPDSGGPGLFSYLASPLSLTKPDEDDPVPVVPDPPEDDTLQMSKLDDGPREPKDDPDPPEPKDPPENPNT